MAKKYKPCEFCQDSIINNDMKAGTANAYLEWYPENGLFAITLYGCDEYGSCGETIEANYGLTFKYCPMCGREVGYR